MGKLNSIHRKKNCVLLKEY